MVSWFALEDVNVRSEWSNNLYDQKEPAAIDWRGDGYPSHYEIEETEAWIHPESKATLPQDTREEVGTAINSLDPDLYIITMHFHYVVSMSIG